MNLPNPLPQFQKYYTLIILFCTTGCFHLERYLLIESRNDLLRVVLFAARITITYDLSTALSIELVEFSARVDNTNQAVLTWITATEKDNDFFTIERSSNGLDFFEIAIVPGAGDHIGLLEYQFIDVVAD